jgi:CubicO group peptidase (beta-lactamase class C family)
MYRLKYFIIIVLMSISGCKEMTDDTILSERAIAENLIDQFIHELIADQQIPGYSIAVTSRDSLIYSNSYGFSDLKLKEKVSNQTLFQIGSITKSFTAIALMQL